MSTTASHAAATGSREFTWVASRASKAGTLPAGFDPLGWTANHDFASQVLRFDALVQNVDRAWRNPNLLVWHRDIWLIDHGAALYFHHNWPTAGPSAPSTPATTCCGTAPRARLTAPRSTIVQPGPVHGGLTTDPEAELSRLFAALVAVTP